MLFRLLALSVLSLIHSYATAQGKLVLVGGGAEGSWSDPAYGWGVAQAENSRVGIISYYDESQALPNYFKQLGARSAINIKIHNRTIAESDTMFDYLMSFDFLFLKGGDQSNYYSTYLNSEVTRAITSKFKEGGVIGGTSAGMAILSGVTYSAEKRSVYPDQPLRNINDEDITLRNDFVNILPGYITDTHFIERGRSFRIMGFMARWYQDHGELITGIAADDKMAICIDENLVGTAIGTGAITILQAQKFTFLDQQFTVDSLLSVQLTDSVQIDLKTKQLLTEYSALTSPEIAEETGNYTVILSGSDKITSNEVFLSDFKSIKSSTDQLIIVSDQLPEARSLIKNMPETNKRILQVSLTSNHADSTELRNAIRKCDKFLFLINDKEDFTNFLVDGPTGELLQSHLKRNNITSGFLGQASELAGAQVCLNNQTDDDASYRNRLKFTEGLGLLQTTAVISNTIDPTSSDFYENNTSALLYLLARKRLKYGLYLHSLGHVKIQPKNGEVQLTHSGLMPTVILTNSSTTGAFAPGRNVVGHDQSYYSVLVDGQTFYMGTPVISQDPTYELEKEVTLGLNSPSITLYPNPTCDKIYITGIKQFSYQITNTAGQVLMIGTSKNYIDVSHLKCGLNYVIINEKDFILRQKVLIF